MCIRLHAGATSPYVRQLYGNEAFAAKANTRTPLSPYALLQELLGRALARRASFLTTCPTGDLLGGALSAVRAQCHYLDV